MKTLDDPISQYAKQSLGPEAEDGHGGPRLSGRQEEGRLGEEKMDHVSCREIPSLCTGVIPAQLGQAGVHREGVLQALLVALQLPAELGTVSRPRPLVLNLGCTLESSQEF